MLDPLYLQQGEHSCKILYIVPTKYTYTSHFVTLCSDPIVCL